MECISINIVNLYPNWIFFLFIFFSIIDKYGQNKFAHISIIKLGGISLKFSICPHNGQTLLANFDLDASLVPSTIFQKVFFYICILKKGTPVSYLEDKPNDSLFLFYECQESVSCHKTEHNHIDFQPLPYYVDLGPSSLCHILTQLTEACPHLYPILESQYQLKLTQQFQETLQNGYHNRMRDLLQTISSNLEKKVRVIEPFTNPIDAVSSSNFFRQLPECSRVIEHLDQNPVYWEKTPQKDMGNCLIIPLYRFNEIIEFLIIGNCDDMPEPLFYSALKTVITALSIEYEMRQSIFTVVNRSRNELMNAITNSNSLNPTIITEWASLLGFKSNRLYIVIYLDFITSGKNQQADTSLYNDVLEFMSQYYHPDDYYFLGSSSDQLYMIGQFPSASAAAAQEKALITCQEIECKLKSKNIIKKMYSGIGTTQQQISDISKSYEDALKALKIAQSIDKSIICYETLGILRLLSSIPSRETAESYIPACLKRLQQYDKMNKSNLTDTLKAYYTSNCNATQAAKSLFIHYKTMLNRLERIQQILECDYNDSHIRLEIEVGLQIIYLYYS